MLARNIPRHLCLIVVEGDTTDICTLYVGLLLESDVYRALVRVMTTDDAPSTSNDVTFGTMTGNGISFSIQLVNVATISVYIIKNFLIYIYSYK